MNIVLILLSVTLNCLAQVLMKAGMLKIGVVDSIGTFFEKLPLLIITPSLVIALAFYVLSLLLWIVVLSKVDVSFAYAFSSLGFVFVTSLGWFCFDEHISSVRILGICLICTGVVLVAKS